MRIYLKLSPNHMPVPFTYQEHLTAALHNWLKDSKIYEGVSLYSFSRLLNGRMKDGVLDFEDGSSFFISCWEISLIRELIRSIREEPEIAFGMRVAEIVIKEDPDLTIIDYFRIASPILIHRIIDRQRKYYFYNDENSGNLLMETIRTKMNIANIEYDDTFKIEFDSKYSKASRKRVEYKGISNPVSICPVIIAGSNIVKQFIWNVGLGNSTGIGFGAIY